jgi:hypothetical protein
MHVCVGGASHHFEKCVHDVPADSIGVAGDSFVAFGS